MFIRAVKKKRPKGKLFIQYSLCQSSRVEGKVKQRTVLYLGSDKELEQKQIRKQVLDLLKNKIFKQAELDLKDFDPIAQQLTNKYYEKYLIKYQENEYTNVTSIPPAAQNAEFHNIDIKSLEVEQVKTFGAEHLCKQTLDKLDLKTCFQNLGFNEDMVSKSLIAIAARAIFTASEHKTVQYLESSSALTDCFNYTKKISHKHLYTVADKLYANKKKIDKFLNERVESMFNLKDRLVIFDISNTYFETSKRESELAQFGRSKEKRSDCPLVVFSACINKAGFITYSNIYKGNTADTELLKDIIEDLEENSQANRNKTIVIDAGIASEENLKLINDKHYKYVCVARKKLNDTSIDKNTIKKVLTDRGKQIVSLKILKENKKDNEEKQKDDKKTEAKDTWMYVHSQQKQVKEDAINKKLSDRFVEQLNTIKNGLTKKGGTKTFSKVWERIGRAKEKYKSVAHLYDIEVKQENQKAVEMNWSLKQVKVDETKGVYFIRTNYQKIEEEQLWQIYNTIRDVESTFRCLKTDLQIRPVHHQIDSRIKSHIYLTILAYQLVNTIRYLLKKNDIKHDWQNIIRIMNTQTIQTIVLPTDKKEIHFCKPSKPIQKAEKIYQATKTKNTQKAIKKYVVYH